MKCILALLTLTIFASYCNGDTVSKSALHPSTPGKCLYNRKYYLPGEHQLPDCTRLICSPKGWASVHSCIESSKIEGCVRGNQINSEQPFPECCKTEYTCQREDGSEYTMINF